MYCVIIGDIVNSREIDFEIREEVTSMVKSTLNRLNTENMDFLMADFGLVRGDAFEGVLLSAYNVPNIIRDIVKSFYSVHKTKVRICVVLGQLTKTGSDRNETDGPAFYQAFEKLAKIKERKSAHWFQVSIETNTVAQPLVESTFDLLTALTESWTDRQREIVWAMEELSEQQSKVSEKLGVSAPVVNKQLKAAEYAAYRQAWLNLERFLSGIEEAAVLEKPVLEKNYALYYSLGQRKSRSQDYTGADYLLRQALALAKTSLSDTDPAHVILLNGIAKNLIQMQKFSEAKKFVEQSLLLQANYPRARLEHASTLNILGDLYLYSENIGEALRYYLEAKETALNAVGQTHPFVALCDVSIEKAISRLRAAVVMR